MSSLTRPHLRRIGFPTEWHAGVTQLLDEHHLVATSANAARRVDFGASLGQFLGNLREVEVCHFHARWITDLDSFCAQLERVIAGGTVERRLHGPRGVVARLRARHEPSDQPASKYRYYLWHDIDDLAARDPVLLARLVDALAGVAAEAEYVSDDLLLIHRAVYIGGPALLALHESARSPFRAWLHDGQGEPFWKAATGVERPPFLHVSIDEVYAG